MSEWHACGMEVSIKQSCDWHQCRREWGSVDTLIMGRIPMEFILTVCGVSDLRKFVIETVDLLKRCKLTGLHWESNQVHLDGCDRRVSAVADIRCGSQRASIHVKGHTYITNTMYSDLYYECMSSNATHICTQQIIFCQNCTVLYNSL